MFEFVKQSLSNSESELGYLTVFETAMQSLSNSESGLGYLTVFVTWFAFAMCSD